MHHLDVDWREFARRTRVWLTLSPATRRHLLAHGNSDFLLPDRLGEDLDTLERERFIAPAGKGRLTVHPGHRSFARALRAMHRHDIVRSPTTATLAGYLIDQYTADERRKLLNYRYGYSNDNVAALVRDVAGEHWLQRALAPDKAAPAPKQRRQSSMLDGDDDAAATALIRLLLERGGVLPVSALPQVMAPERVTGAVNTALRAIWLFATMRADDLEPVLVLWPPTAARLLRPPPRQPAAETPTDEVQRAFLLDDAAAVLVAASAEPLRLRANDHQLFAKTAERIERELADLPPLFRIVVDFDREVRIHAALRMLFALGYIRAAGSGGRDLRLETTAAARAWLAAPLPDRLFAFADAVRRAGWAPHEQEPLNRVRAPAIDSEDADVDDDDFDDVDLEDLDVADPEFDDPDALLAALEYGYVGEPLDVLPPHMHLGMQKPLILAAVAEAYALVPEQSTASLDELFAYCARAHNPLLEQSVQTGFAGGRPLRYATDEEREAHWQQVLGHVLVNWLLPLGGVRVAALPGKRRGIRMTPIGRYMLGLAPTFDPTAALAAAGAAGAASAPRIIVQPNFDIVFIAPSPIAEAEIGRFAERVGRGVGSVFRITRTSVFDAAAAGIIAEDALATLCEFSSHPLPPNVKREITGWFAACRRVRAAPAWIIRCPDEDTATRVLSAAGRDVRRIGPTVLELIEPKQRTALARKLRKQGIFLDITAESPTPARRRSRRT